MNERTIEILLAIMFIVLASALFFNLYSLMGNAVSNEASGFHSYTKAVCDRNNFCEDYFIECEGSKALSVTATGFAVQFLGNWKDNRNLEDIEKTC